MDLVDLPWKCAAWKNTPLPSGYDDDKGDDRHHVHAFATQFWIYFIAGIAEKKKHNKKSRTSQSAHICQDQAFSFPRFFLRGTSRETHGNSTWLFGTRWSRKACPVCTTFFARGLGLKPQQLQKYALGHPQKLHPGKLTWNLKIPSLKRKIIFQTSITVFHVNFPGCNCFWTPKVMCWWMVQMFFLFLFFPLGWCSGWKKPWKHFGGGADQAPEKKQKSPYIFGWINFGGFCVLKILRIM